MEVLDKAPHCTDAKIGDRYIENGHEYTIFHVENPRYMEYSYKAMRTDNPRLMHLLNNG